MAQLRLGRVPDPLSDGGDDDLDPAGLFKSSDQAYRQDVLPRSQGEQPVALASAPTTKPTGTFKFDLYGTNSSPEAQPTPKEGTFKFNLYGDAEPKPEPKKAADSGDTSRGFQAALGQTPALLKGAVGFLGAVGEKTLGEGGNFTALKQWGLEGYKKGMDAISARSKDTDELTSAWDKAKGGDLGALVDWAQYGIGYLGGNVLETAHLHPRRCGWLCCSPGRRHCGWRSRWHRGQGRRQGRGQGPDRGHGRQGDGQAGREGRG